MAELNNPSSPAEGAQTPLIPEALEALVQAGIVWQRNTSDPTQEMQIRTITALEKMDVLGHYLQ